MDDIILFAKKRYAEIRSIRKDADHDTYFAVVKSTSGNFYDSTPLQNGLCPICCERAAMAQMITNEGETAKVEEIVLVGAIGDGGLLTPCGVCRQAIYDNSPDAKVIVCSGKFHKGESCDFIFDKPVFYSIRDLLPNVWKLGTW